MSAPVESICAGFERSMVETATVDPSGEKSPSEKTSAAQLGLHLRAEKFAHHSLLLFVLAAGIVFFTVIKAFLVPVILAAVFAGLFYPFYSRVLKFARGRKALSAFFCC